MADRYWVGGSGTWDLTNTANWSATSGGAAGASVPTSDDNVYFDGASDAGAPFTVTFATQQLNCKDLIIGNGTTVSALDQPMTLAGTLNVLGIYGSLFFPSTNLTRTFTGPLGFYALSGSHTVTTNGITLAAASNSVNCVVFGRSTGSAATWTLGSALTISTGTLVIRPGTTDTANYNVTVANSISFLNTPTKTLTLGSSTVSCGGDFTFGSGANTTNTTINAGTSTINMTSAGGLTSNRFCNGLSSNEGFTFYNLSFTSGAAGLGTIYGSNTFNNVNQISRSPAGIRGLRIGGNQVINGTLTLGAANTAIRRLFVWSDVTGTQRTLTLNGTLAALSDVDFRDIKAAGTVATPWTGTRLGDCKGNASITFDAPKTVYWNLAGAQNWTATGWALTNNGVPAANNFPLPQDTATFTEAGAAGTVTINAAWNIGAIQMADGVSNRTTAFTLATGTQTPIIYKNVTLFSSLTLTGTGVLTFAGQGTTQQITSAGIPFTQAIVIDVPSGTFQLQDTFSGQTFTLLNGTVKFFAGTTSTVTTFATGGKNQKFLQSTSSGVQATLSQSTGTVNAQYLDAKDIAVTGGATWNLVNGSVNRGNISGWYVAHQQGGFIPALIAI